MRYLPALLVPCVALLALAASVAAERPQEQADKSARVPLDVPEAEKNRKNPVPADKGSIDYGKLLFSSQCTMCHGQKGDGSGDLAVKYGYPVPDFTRSEQQKEWTDGELFYVLTHGHGKMPAQGSRFEDKHKWDLVNYIRSLDD